MPPATDQKPPETSGAKLLLRRTLIAVGLVLVLLVPALIMAVVVTIGTGRTEPAATWAAMPAIAGIAAVVGGGVELGVTVAIVMSLLAPLSVVAGATPITGAALMALMCLMVGRLSRFGLHRATMLVPILIAWPLIAPPPWAGQQADRMNTTFLAWLAAIFFVGAIFPVLVLPFALRHRARPALAEHSRAEAIPYTAMITVLTAVGTAVVLAHPRQSAGAFLVATILVLAPLGDVGAGLKPTLQRVVGTVLGSLAVIVIVAEVQSLALVYAIGLLFGVAAVVSKLSSRPIVYYVLMVPTAACLNAYTTSQVGEIGEQRVVDNLVGAALVLLAMALSLGFARWQGRRHDDLPEQGLPVGSG